MREDNLLCVRKRKFVVTTDSNHGRKVYPNLAGQMMLTGIDQLWVADITYIRLEAEFVYLGNSSPWSTAYSDAGTREITLASAGHPRPLVINHDCSLLDLDTGLPLGLGPSQYPERTLTLAPGTELLLYTDGITEAMNSADEEYGPARIMEHFQQPEACVESLVAEVQSFSAGSDQTDDATVVLIRSR